ncbi:MAG: hydroxyacylglutathione hydrolase, partial [Acinetobacter sp.]|nr:hydroxyacylglutathione hydrolase [Acinetobacter sp.]
MSLSLHEAFKVHILDVQNPLQNYIFLLEDVRTHDVVVIDPTHAELVLDYCQQHSLNIKHIWITHHHQDHTAGIADLVAQYAVPVYAPQDELSKIPCATHGLSHEQVIDFNDIQIEIIATAGHTLGHICYFIDALDTLFSGDTLFVMGCGRVIEGTHQQMYHSLNRLAALPARTVVYCSHEYSLNNAQFALHIEPDNLAVQQRLADIQQLREQNLPTVP